ncbi:MAG: hypothetical protein A3D13_02285 [Planctomycetes bacterium RIFCSPHIGHO2_02_FULL_40_12]|nr:MAG: hypothetical protein A3D13_02285 [Planctomycetes bacterium RIFCSPHIGHO2_02_FULL_40_12]OHC01321.1 MAG: hypothetical protein A3H23_03555 [Planctomycetes bacterium RIFCSPLOWO2_12_FULL_40_19]
MTKSLYATFDGHVFTPEENINLLPNRRYLISIETPPSQKPGQEGKVLQRIAARAKDLGISDLAAQHDHYLYGTEKQ